MADFRPNLAGTPADDSQIPMPCIASPKIDGLRGMKHKDGMMSRSMKPIPSLHVQRCLDFPDLLGLDGELVVGSPTDPNCMQNSTSGIMAKDKKPDFTFYVFDMFDYPGGFRERYLALAKRVEYIQQHWSRFRVMLRLDSLVAEGAMMKCPIQLVEHRDIATLDELNEYEAECIDAGYEGVMVRKPDGLYKQGRSTAKEGGLLKIKRFTDAEAIVVGFEEEMKNNNAKVTNELGRSKRSSHKAGKEGKGTLGAFVCRRFSVEKGVHGPNFNIGTGMTAEFRASVWANKESFTNAIVKFKHFEHGVVDAPRHPVFIGFRAPEDMS